MPAKLRDALLFHSQPPDALAINVYHNFFPPGIGLITFAGVNCRGNETNLADCEMPNNYYYGHCSHREDVGVICLMTSNSMATPNTSTPGVTSSQATSSPVSASIIGGSMGGALILIIVLFILVVIIAVVQRKKAAVQSFQLEVLAR